MDINILKIKNQETGVWEKIPALKGDKGEPGATGPQGEAGPAGKDGADGVYVGTSEPQDENIRIWLNPDGVPGSVATLSQVGVVKPDGTTITVSEDGTLSLAVANFEGSEF